MRLLDEAVSLLPVCHTCVLMKINLILQLVKAEDSDGLFSTARVNIRVTDINDKNPEFQGTPYVFQIREGETNLLIGSVHAEDADEGQNALVYYSLPNDVPFDIDTMTGEIRTKVPLDFEKNRASFFIFFLII